MDGSERLKFCEKCGCHVSNLSLLTAEERNRLLERAGHERICGSYYLRLSGEMVTPDLPLSPGERSRIRQLGVATLSAAAITLVAGCVASQTSSADSITTTTINTPSVQPESVAAAKNEAKSDDLKDSEEIILFVGLICEPTPTYKPGRGGR